MAEKIAYEKKGEVAYITFNRPEAKNAIDLEMHCRLREIWTDFRDDSRLRVAVVTGTGDAFCAGADLKTHVPEWANAGPSLARDKLPDGFAGGITRGLHRLYKPIFAAVTACSVDYLSPARLGDWVEATVTLAKATRSLIFTQALITANGETVARTTALYRNIGLDGRAVAKMGQSTAHGEETTP